MSEHLISNHPLDELDTKLYLESILDANGLDENERRQVAEHKAAYVTESVSLERSAEVICWLAFAHIPQLNARFEDLAASRHYSNPVELIREESKRRDNKKIWYKGNIADAHKRIVALDKQIVSEETPAEMRKTLLWALLFGVVFLALGILSVSTGAGVSLVTKLINSTLFYVLFTLVTLGFSLFFGFFSIGVLIVGGVFLIAWIIFTLPGLASVIINGVLFVVGGIFLLVAFDYIKNIKNYRPLTEEEHNLNQERIKERDAIKQELKEYSELMLSKLSIMKSKFVNDSTAFIAEMHKTLGGTYDYSSVNEIFSFLNRYYRKMKK